MINEIRFLNQKKLTGYIKSNPKKTIIPFYSTDPYPFYYSYKNSLSKDGSITKQVLEILLFQAHQLPHDFGIIHLVSVL